MPNADWSPIDLVQQGRIEMPYEFHRRTLSLATMNFAGDNNVPVGAIEFDSLRSQFRRWNGADWDYINLRTPSTTVRQEADQVIARSGGLVHPANDFIISPLTAGVPNFVEGFLSITFALSGSDTQLDHNYFVNIEFNNADRSRTRYGTSCPQLDVESPENTVQNKIQGASGQRGFIVANYSEPGQFRTDCYFYAMLVVNGDPGSITGSGALNFYLNDQLDNQIITLHRDSWVRVTRGV